MSHQDYTVTIEVERSPQDVYKAITDDVSKWWGGKDLTGNSSKLNDEFIIHHSGAHYSKQKLVELIPNEKLVWLVTDSKLDWLEKDQHEWTNTKMIFEIEKRDSSNVLHFTHQGLSPEMESYTRCSEGWKMVITAWLFNFIANGEAHF